MTYLLKAFLVTAAFSIALACYSYRPVTATGPATLAARVRVSFAMPREVRIDREGTSPLVLQQVRYLDGRVVQFARDTLLVNVDEARDSFGTVLVQRAPNGPGQISTIALADSSTSVQAYEANIAGTLGLAAGILALVAAAGLVAFVHSFHP
jgi:hypothetical protein